MRVRLPRRPAAAGGCDRGSETARAMRPHVRVLDVYVVCAMVGWEMSEGEGYTNRMLCRTQHPCAKSSKDDAEKTNIVWEPSKDWKHLNVKLLIMFGFENEDKVTNYIRLVMERATVLKRIELHNRVAW
ncbi:hypothetical protein ZWY2020_001710 [Hordeum vulgare]|nr:hypothetical protein ZWY2020_001710 [Hordeum vulgare]